MALGLSFSCAGDQQQGQGDQLESQENYEDDTNIVDGNGADEENNNYGNNQGRGEEAGNEGYNEEGNNEEANNYGADNENEELPESNLGEEEENLSNNSDVTEDNLNEGYNNEGNAYGEDDVLANGVSNESELDETIDEMSQGNNAELAEKILNGFE